MSNNCICNICLEDINLQLKSKRRLSFFIGIGGFAITFCRFYILNSVEDKYYYFNLPFGIFFLIIILKPFTEKLTEKTIAPKWIRKKKLFSKLNWI